MRIAILSDDYLPDSTLNHAKMLHHLAKEFVKRGHQVVVLVPSTIKSAKRVECEDLDGVDIWRFHARPTRGVGLVWRAINETLLGFYAIRAIKSLECESNFDLVVNYSPPIFFGVLSRWLRRRGSFVYLILRDFFPQWVIDEGLISQKSLSARYFRFFEKLNYRCSDVVAVQSQANLRVFSDISPCEHPRLEVLHNWSEVSDQVSPMFGREFLSARGLGEKFVFFYGGNIGHAQDIPALLRLAKALLPYESAHVLILGQGDQFEVVKGIVARDKLTNVTLSGSVNQAHYQSLLTQVHVGLFSLSAKHRAHNFPGKVTGYLASGLPVLGMVNQGNDIIEVINESGAGTVVVNGQDGALSQAAIKLLQNKDYYCSSKRNTYLLLGSKFSVEGACEQITRSYRMSIYP